MEGEEAERPRAVTVIGWTWIVLSGVLALKALLNLLAWTVLSSAAPTVLRGLGEQFSHVPVVQILLAHAGAVMAAQAVFWMIVGFCAWNFLRMRTWARLAIQTICYLGLVYAGGFLILWVELWQKSGLAARDPSLTEARRSLALFAGLSIWILFAALFVVMLGFLRSARVRGAFAGPPAAG